MRSFLRQLGWSFGSRLVSAALQLVVVVLLARGLVPRDFAWVAAVNVVLLAVVALNGFGLVRQLQYRRSLDPDDPSLPGIFDLWQRFVSGSAVLWALGCLVVVLVSGDTDYLALLPLAVWLSCEQLTTLWNAVSIVDGRSRDLMSSYLWRRVPVVLTLAAALAADLDTVWAWSLGLALGSVLAYVAGLPRAQPWARSLVPHGQRREGDAAFDLSYWWAEVGVQLRDLDVAVVTAISAVAGGFYALPARLVRPMNLVTMAAAQVAYPRIVRASRISQRHLLLGCLLGTAPVTLVAAVVAGLAGWLPLLVGDEYDDAVPVLRILCLAAVVVGFGTLVITFLQARSRAANRFAGQIALATAVGQVVAAAVGAATGDAVTVAWATTVVLAVATAIGYVRAAVECRREAAGTAGPGAEAEDAPAAAEPGPV